jgi:hypothetical protein
MGQLSIVVLIIPPVAGLVTYFVVRFFSKRNELEIASRRKKSPTIRELSVPPRARKQNAFLRLTSLVFVSAKKRLRSFDKPFRLPQREARLLMDVRRMEVAGPPSPMGHGEKIRDLMEPRSLQREAHPSLGVQCIDNDGIAVPQGAP